MSFLALSMSAGAEQVRSSSARDGLSLWSFCTSTALGLLEEGAKSVLDVFSASCIWFEPVALCFH